MYGASYEWLVFDQVPKEVRFVSVTKNSVTYAKWHNLSFFDSALYVVRAVVEPAARSVLGRFSFRSMIPGPTYLLTVCPMYVGHARNHTARQLSRNDQYFAECRTNYSTSDSWQCSLQQTYRETAREQSDHNCINCCGHWRLCSAPWSECLERC